MNIDVYASNSANLSPECPWMGLQKALGKGISRGCGLVQDSFGKYCFGPKIKLTEMGHG